jgi:hypothetical protein
VRTPSCASGAPAAADDTELVQDVLVEEVATDAERAPGG